MPRQREDVGVHVGYVKVLNRRDKAFQVELPSGELKWIPYSQVHDDSEVYEHCGDDEGELVVSTWLAEKEGLGD